MGKEEEKKEKGKEEGSVNPRIPILCAFLPYCDRNQFILMHAQHTHITQSTHAFALLTSQNLPTTFFYSTLLYYTLLRKASSPPHPPPPSQRKNKNKNTPARKTQSNAKRKVRSVSAVSWKLRKRGKRIFLKKKEGRA